VAALSIISPDGAIPHPYPAPQEGACALTYQRGPVTAAARAGGPANRLDFLDASQFRGEIHRFSLLYFLEFFRQNPDFSMSYAAFRWENFPRALFLVLRGAETGA
jgi:hypothetical protein